MAQCPCTHTPHFNEGHGAEMNWTPKEFQTIRSEIREVKVGKCEFFIFSDTYILCEQSNPVVL